MRGTTTRAMFRFAILAISIASIAGLIQGCSGKNGDGSSSSLMNLVDHIKGTNRVSMAVSANATLNTHTVMLDGSGSIVSWVPNQDQAYDTVIGLAWNYLLTKVPNDPKTGQPAYFSQSYIDPDSQLMADWPSNPAGMNAMLIESALLYYAYSGNSQVLQFAQNLANHHLAQGMTLTTDHWSKVPYASGDAGSMIYQGAAYGNQTGAGDGAGYIEPDKVGEFGFALLQLFKLTGNTAYRDAAVNAANQLASHVRTGSATSSPWPFRVKAQTNAVREDYCADVIAPIELFDELIRLGLGNVASYQTARATAWNWLMNFPMKNNNWANYFEDVGTQGDISNYNQYNALMTARYFLRHPEMNPNWETHTRNLIAWDESTFGAMAYGAMTIKEQVIFAHPMGSHTSRYASVNALLYAKTGDTTAQAKAYRSFNWSTYMARSTGVVIDGPTVNNQWFTDGYGDYVRHFIVGMGASPEWAPVGSTHILDSTSLVKSVTYTPSQINYQTFDNSGVQVIKVASAPTSVTVNGVLIPQRSDLGAEGWTFDNGSVLRVRHESGNTVAVGLNGAPANQLPSVAITSPANGAAFTAPASFQIQATASDSDGSISKVEFYNNGTLLGTSTTAPYSWSVSGLAAGSHSLSARAYDNQNGVSNSNPVAVTVTNPGGGGTGSWTGVDIGSVGVPGSTVVNGGTITVKGSGVDIWDAADSFHFAYQQMTGDGEIKARIVTQQNTDPWALAGVMMRETLAANSKEALSAITPSHGMSFDYRTTTGGATTYVNGNAGVVPYWVRLVRAGNTFTSSKSSNGTTWTTMGSATISMASTIYVGLAVTSHVNTVLATDTFDNVSFTGQSGGGDITPPVISNVASADISQNGATITWTTNEPSSSQIEYGLTTSYGTSTSVNTSLETSHTQVIAGLNASATYHYRVKSTDAAGNAAVSGDFTFVTPGAPDTTPPSVAISAPSGTVSGTVTVSASASDDINVASVQFQLDGANLGSLDTASPYQTTWNTTGVANGAHALTAIAKDGAGNTTVSAPVSVTVNNVVVPPPALSIDKTAFTDTKNSTVTVSGFTTTKPNELLLAFVSTDGTVSNNTTVTRITTTGLTWTLVKRTNTQAGTSEVWRAFSINILTNASIAATLSKNVAASLVVVSFVGTDPASPVGTSVSANASSGAAAVTLVTTRNNSWVFAVGNDWDKAIARTLGPNQTMVHQYLPSVGDTLWVQRQNAPTPNAGTSVIMNTTAPTTDRYNFTAVEILSP